MSIKDKQDSDKLDLSIIPPDFTEAVARVLIHGEKKYSRCGWRSVEDANRRYFSALLRHIHAFRKGEEIDPESGLHHFAHAAANLAILIDLLSTSNYDIGKYKPSLVDTRLDGCPSCGGDADNGYDRMDPPNPYECSKCEQHSKPGNSVKWSAVTSSYSYWKCSKCGFVVKDKDINNDLSANCPSCTNAFTYSDKPEKLRRDTSTPEKKAYWDGVDRAAARAPRLKWLRMRNHE